MQVGVCARSLSPQRCLDMPLTCLSAFGGTLSSYTWICLIVAFLQLRTPPVLPALHQLPYKIQKPNGAQSDFADNLKKLRGYGSKNKSSEAELLFQFFRFYAHEFDYDKYVLSVRLGKMIPKSDKNWQFAVNNQLCVEEPFNLGRNLGNTADEYSFRGLHMELRRAFDLISAGKFEEACEEYVFPKEEERVWTRPPTQPRPVLLRSASQTHNSSGRGGRGGHRGGRHNNHHRGGGGGPGSSRRTSSSVPPYDPSVFPHTVNIQQDLSWYPSPQFAMHYPQDFLTHLALHQQENFRQMQQMYAQGPGFGQQQGMGQQMMTSAPTSGQGQSSDRSRTNSFDNQPPISAPLRPDLFALYGMTLGSPLFAQAGTGYAGYPASPVTASGPGQDYRRPLQRSTVTTDKGAAAASSSLRSQSQPAARSPSATQPNVPGQQLPLSQSATRVPSTGSRNPNGIPIPSFMSDDADFDETPKASSTPPHSEETMYAAYNSESPGTSSTSQQPQGSSNGVASGELANQPPSSNPGRRRLSTDQLPQTILDRRMKRTSRSPSPLGHSRAFSAGTGSASVSAAVPGSSAQPRNLKGPLVVNGSGLKARTAAASRLAPSAEGPAPGEVSPPAVGQSSQIQQGRTTAGQQPQTDQGPFTAASQPPLIVNGSNVNPAQGSEDQSFRERIAMLSSYYMTPSYLAQDPTFAGSGQLTPAARQHLVSQQPQNAVIAPLDLAISNSHVRRPAESEGQVLSPVYETHAPSSTAARKPDVRSKTSKASHTQDPKQSGSAAAVRQNPKLDDQVQRSQEAAKQSKNAKPAVPTPKVNSSRESGHVRGARSETDQGWQKAGKGKKKATSTTQQSNAEPPPKNVSERKGG